MKNIIEILKGLGIEIPADKEADVNKEVAENYKTVAEFDKKVSKMQGEIDRATERATTAEETLKGFEGKDFDAITQERDSWQKKYEDRIKAEADAKEKAELDEAIANAIKTAKGKNANAIIANLDMESIKASHNRDKDIAEAIKALSESEETAFLFDTDPEQSRAQFTTGMSGSNANGGKRMTRQEIMAVSDRTERRKLIRENMDLFGETDEN